MRYCIEKYALLGSFLAIRNHRTFLILVGRSLLSSSRLTLSSPMIRLQTKIIFVYATLRRPDGQLFQLREACCVSSTYEHLLSEFDSLTKYFTNNGYQFDL